MTEKRKMSLVPPNTKQEEKLKAFIEEPDLKTKGMDPEPEKAKQVDQKIDADDNQLSETAKPSKEPLYPWEMPGVTAEIVKNTTLRLNQPDKLKINYIVENSLEYKSMHDFLLKAIHKLLNEDLKKLGV